MRQSGPLSPDRFGPPCRPMSRLIAKLPTLNRPAAPAGLVPLALGLAVVAGAASGAFGNQIILLAALGLAGLALLILRPEVGFVLMFLAVPLETIYWSPLGFRVKAYQVLGIAILIALAVQVLIQRKRLVTTRLDLPLLLVGASYLASLLLHFEYAAAGRSLMILQVWFLLTVWIVANYGQSPRLLKAAFWAIVAGGVFEALFGLVQAGGFYHAPESATEYHAILVSGRPYGTFTEPDFYAPFILIAFFLTLPFLVDRARHRWRSLLNLVTFLLFALLMLSMVRAVWVGLLMGLLVFAVLYLKEGLARNLPRLGKLALKFLVGGALLLVVFQLFYPSGFEALTTRARNILAVAEPENPNLTRLNELQGAIAAIQMSPWIGHGVGTYGLLTEYGRSVAETTGRENGGVVGAGILFGILFDQGVLGLIPFLLLMSLLFLRVWRSIQRGPPAWKPYGQGLLLSLVAVIGSGLFNNDYYFGYFWMTIALAVAFVTYIARRGAASQ